MNSYSRIESSTDALDQKQRMPRSRAILISTVSVFVMLTLLGNGLMLGARGATDTFEQNVLLHVGGAIFGGALAFFLVQIFSYAREFGQFRDE